ncbi:glycosyltransferase [Capillimicrobium parvum]|uniref:Glucosyl-3-phosphoglycerate synthase n=1 Tax=Capillimicrobium parvum TaxID=2884022 RepID=A0A9E6Y2R3_9ACTN|nr:glycosyltransferase [Capillimicrobium parvum]UGS38914.1 Glucosyl-3-phosphoglycerate synthase [Capillimicrobium parvum]
MDHVAWRRRRSFPAEAFAGVLSGSPLRVAVCVPARDEEETIAGVLAPLVALRDEGLVADVAVAFSASRDRTLDEARDAGARIIDVGSPSGKGDAIWRAQEEMEGDIVCLVDGDLIDVDRHWIEQLAGPLIADPAIGLVKGAFARPLNADGTLDPSGGGRVTELLAKPLLRRFYPELTVLRQPLSGQIAIRRDLLASLPVWTGYALEIGMLIETWRRAGLEAIAEADIGVVRNRHQRLADLAAMSEAILWCVAVQLARDGRLTGPDGEPPAGVVERPPIYAPRP